MQSVEITVYGLVQGVFFRKSTKQFAEKNGITGFVRNMPDGTVYIQATGAKEDLNRFIDWCNHGPEHACVDSFVIKQIPDRDFSSFNIRYF